MVVLILWIFDLASSAVAVPAWVYLVLLCVALAWEVIKGISS